MSNPSDFIPRRNRQDISEKVQLFSLPPNAELRKQTPTKHQIPQHSKQSDLLHTDLQSNDEFARGSYHFLVPVPTSLCIMTWNVGNSDPPSIPELICIFKEMNMRQTLQKATKQNRTHPSVATHPPDMFVIGLQEVDLNVQGLIKKETIRSTLWSSSLLSAINKTFNSFSRNSSSISEESDNPYCIVAEKQFVGLFLVIFSLQRHKSNISTIETKTIGTGMMNTVGNKGAIAIRFRFYESVICFVVAHLAAHQNKVSLRNKDYREIFNRIHFNPIPIHSSLEKETCQCCKPSNSEHIHQERQISLTKSNFLFFFGDLNYRIDLSTEKILESIVPLCSSANCEGYSIKPPTTYKLRPSPPPPPARPPGHSKTTFSTNQMTSRPLSVGSSLTTFDNQLQTKPQTSKSNALAFLYQHDQLRKQRKEGAAFQLFEEGPITFLPTYKYDKKTGEYQGQAILETLSKTNRPKSPLPEPTGSLTSHSTSQPAPPNKDLMKLRSPAWCDRILWFSGRQTLSAPRSPRPDGQTPFGDSPNSSPPAGESPQSCDIDTSTFSSPFAQLNTFHVHSDSSTKPFQNLASSVTATQTILSPLPFMSQTTQNEAPPLMFNPQDAELAQPVKQIVYNRLETSSCSDHRSVFSLFTFDTFHFDNVKISKSIQERLAQFDRALAETIPQTTISANDINCPNVSLGKSASHEIRIQNTGKKIHAKFSVIDPLSSDPSGGVTSDPTSPFIFSFTPSSGVIAPHKSASVFVRVSLNPAMIQTLHWKSPKSFEKVFVIHIDEGKDHFITVFPRPVESCVGMSPGLHGGMVGSMHKSLLIQRPLGSSPLAKLTVPPKISYVVPPELFRVCSFLSQHISTSVDVSPVFFSVQRVFFHLIRPLYKSHQQSTAPDDSSMASDPSEELFITLADSPISFLFLPSPESWLDGVPGLRRVVDALNQEESLDRVLQAEEKNHTDRDSSSQAELLLHSIFLLVSSFQSSLLPLSFSNLCLEALQTSTATQSWILTLLPESHRLTFSFLLSFFKYFLARLSKQTTVIPKTALLHSSLVPSFSRVESIIISLFTRSVFGVTSKPERKNDLLTLAYLELFIHRLLSEK
ncbi:putative Type II inositol 1,4,5-trisphosphate 5-phosphatase [Blattamonas nauphoetae]|uniref:Type II inositol 1,4,5-trisphosphate 5-phosphatase n=1 Tax=Blattamonas nauphoetae TaxID=2049346 RepID=A0ABQ9YLT9_9EUKA|nr:putative Type II inositol 1,4,5-trisphosphate 5-phosphatase [Blattamonas nauphoetae]